MRSCKRIHGSEMAFLIGSNQGIHALETAFPISSFKGQILRFSLAKTKVYMLYISRFLLAQAALDTCFRDNLKVHKIENFFDSDFGKCVISLLVVSKY